MQRAYQHLQAENSQLREELLRLEDKEGRGRAGGPSMLARSSPDGQQDIDREAAQHLTERNITRSMTDTES